MSSNLWKGTEDSPRSDPSGPLRIALFSDSAFPILNGVSVSIDSLIRELRSLGHSVHMFTTGYPGHKDSDPNTHRFRSVFTPWVKDYPFAIPPFTGMLREFRRQRFDIIHTHTPFTVGFVGLRWGQSHEIPVVSTYHTLYDRYAHYVPYIPRRYLRFKIAKHTRFYYNSVEHVFTPSEAAKRWLLRHQVRTPVSVVPTGPPARTLLDRSLTRQELQLEPGQINLLYVGRLAEEKNLDLLFEMVAQVMRDIPRVRLSLVGDGPYRAHCQELARSLGIGDKVRFAGFVPRQEVDKHYAAADLFVFSSVTETQGLVVQEAMGYGLPAVVVAGGGASEAVKPGVNGIVVRNDLAEFRDAVLKVLQDDALLCRLSEGARATIQEASQTSMADRIVKVYREILYPNHEHSLGRVEAL